MEITCEFLYNLIKICGYLSIALLNNYNFPLLVISLYHNVKEYCVPINLFEICVWHATNKKRYYTSATLVTSFYNSLYLPSIWFLVSLASCRCFSGCCALASLSLMCLIFCLLNYFRYLFKAFIFILSLYCTMHAMKYQLFYLHLAPAH